MMFPLPFQSPSTQFASNFILHIKVVKITDVSVYDQLAAKESPPLEISQALKIIRRIAGMTQAEYAVFCNVHPSTIKGIEQGTGNPTLSTLNLLLAPFQLRLTVCAKERQ